jgi:Glyoxalase/Bleomycin resistance protein/Dioxygenase superfamily
VSLLAGADLFHTGLTVPDLDSAMKDLGQLWGLVWAGPVRRTGPLHTPAGVQPRDMRITYSRGGPHHIELVEYIDDTAYTFMTDGPPQHHVGHWSHDFRGDIARLEESGFPCEASGIAQDGGRGEFSYHRNPHNGGWIELVDARGQRAFSAWTAPLRATAPQHDNQLSSREGQR